MKPSPDTPPRTEPLAAAAPVKKLFRPSRFAWWMLILWWGINIAFALSINQPLNSRLLGYLTGEMFLPPLVAAVPATIIWLLAGRSPRAGSRAFTFFLLLLFASRVAAAVGTIRTQQQPLPQRAASGTPPSP